MYRYQWICVDISRYTEIGTLFQFGRPALVRDLRPVTRSRCSFLKLRSMASCRNTDFMSVFCSAEVMYLQIVRYV